MPKVRGLRLVFRSIPVHRNQDLKVGTLRALMKIAQLSEDDLL
ncbi:type II toxin-antitoxin system HicA family toxin [Nodularia spumigena]|nr:type II toxin-antitoxin system HicA family toxin [Nodularia spumigena]